ncbi:MAG: IS30 family transposase [Xanthomonadales bacterium]|nr:IS30 family transposase [Xanthomonadales bacterium]
MGGRAGWGLTGQQKAELWERWRHGESVNEIARALDKRASSVFDALRRQGGIYRPPRKRSARYLTLGEREEISRGIAAGVSIRQIAGQLGRAPSTVSREIVRNGGRAGYRASMADKAAWQRALRPKPCKLAQHPRLRSIVAAKLRLRWSPEQIAGWLKNHYPEDESLHVSHETIYRSLYVQSRGALKKELMAHLRSQRKMRRGKTATRKSQGRGQIVDAVSISERPASAEDRAVPGHWEGDLLAGSRNTHIATLVERHSRFVMLAKLDGRDTHSVVDALIKKMKRLPAELRKSLTWDRGAEMAQHKKITIATDLELYFCDPHSPWQRGSNENTNGLLRQYFPKGTDLSVHSQAKLNAVAKQLNQRPRKTLGFKTPAEKLQATVAMIS